MSRSTSAIHLDVHPDMRILAFTALVSLVAVIVFGLIPAWRASRLDLSQAVKEGNRAATAALGRSRIGEGLVIPQIALSLVLTVGAGLLVRTDRKSTRLNSSHGYISYAVFCLKKKSHQHNHCGCPQGVLRASRHYPLGHEEGSTRQSP